jgi:hypothetical protein
MGMIENLSGSKKYWSIALYSGIPTQTIIFNESSSLNSDVKNDQKTYLKPSFYMTYSIL